MYESTSLQTRKILATKRTLTPRNKNDSTVFSYLAQVAQYHIENAYATLYLYQGI